MKNLNRIVQSSIAAVLLLLAAPAPVHANSETPGPTTDPTVFEAVDSVEVFNHLGLVVGGVVQSQSQRTEVQFYFADGETTTNCQKQALLSAERPGRYLLSLTLDNSGYGYACKLIRR